MKSKIKYSIIIPVYNEEEVIDETYKRLTKVMKSTEEPYELIFINDGSADKTVKIIHKLYSNDKSVKLLDFSRNFGHQIAISAGMDCAAGEAIVVIDADLQDPPHVILDMIEKWKQGYDVVYAKRITREGETFFKKLTAAIFYRTLKKMTDVDIPVDVGDFRLIDKKVCNVMQKLTEKNRYVRGLVSWAGFRQTSVEYEREERWAGDTKYPLSKMLKFALDGMTSFSYKPLKMATYIGFILSGASFIYLIVVLLQKLLKGNTFPGWASIIVVNLFFNGVVLIILGIIGEYIGRIYDESKGRPLYIIKDKVGFDEQIEEK